MGRTATEGWNDRSPARIDDDVLPPPPSSSPDSARRSPIGRTLAAEARIEGALFASASCASHQTALVDGETRVAYGELAARASAFARLLRDRGLRPGDRATIFLDKTIDAVVALYGVWRAGGVAVPAAEGLKARQLGHILRHSESRCLVTTGAKRTRSGIDDLHGAKLVLTDPAPPAGDVDPGRAGGREPAAILYTSGSTGLPKGIVLSHDNLLAGTRIVAGYLRLTARDRILSLLPFSFDYGLNQLLTAVARGAVLVLQRSHYPADVCRSLASHRITGLAGVPPVWVQLMAATSPLPSMRLPHLRYITNSGGTFPKELLRRYRAHLPHVRIYLMYGLTEAFRSTYLPPELVDRLPDSIGQAIPETEVFVVDRDGRRCGPDEVGELVHRGPTVALGYWRDPQATEDRFRRHSWSADPSERVVYSGDLVRTDHLGFLYYVGRSDQLMKCYGHRVSPEEVEGMLLASEMVQEAVARGEADPVAGARIVAHVVPKPGTYSRSALLAWCRREMPSHMVPGRIVEHDELPRTSSLKLDRQQVQG